MYYVRVIFAIIGGVATGALQLTGIAGLAFGILIYIVTFLLFKHGIPSFSSIPDKKKFYMTGIFSYFLLWYVCWVISINILYPVVA